MPRFTNIKTGTQKMGDEPLRWPGDGFATTYLLLNQLNEGTRNINGATEFEIDVMNRWCNYKKYGMDVWPSMVHFGTDNTKRYHYRKEIIKMEMAEKGWLGRIVNHTKKITLKYLYATKVFLSRLLLLNFKHYHEFTRCMTLH
ncbi:MAG: hypothetical protein U5K72_14530 [Balneolaceae bacterium]|nr:hypothetical protein [Balneolaceae bacterium]